MGRKARQHVNPLSLLHMDTGVEPLKIPGRSRIEVDLGCASGHYLFRRAEIRPDAFLIGIEIRRTLVDEINKKAAALEIEDRVQACYANLLLDFPKLFTGRTVDLITMHFPDPWFKKKHEKRRALMREFAEFLPSALKPGAMFFFQTDVFELALDALFTLDTTNATQKNFVNDFGSWSFAPQNPLGALTQREIACRKKNRKIWRLQFSRA